MKLIYVAYGNVSVFSSQVVALLNHYILSDKFKEIILLFGVDYNAKVNENKLKDLDENIRVMFFKQYPQYMLIENKTIKSIAKTLKEVDKLDEYVIHIRNEVTAHYVFKAIEKIGIKNNKLLADVRGAGLEQLLEFSNKNKLILAFKKIQREKVDGTLSKIKNISVVSDALKFYIMNKLGVDLNIYVNSCLANQSFKFNPDDRINIRDELNISTTDNLLVLSTGGDSPWQNTAKTINFLTDRNFKVLNLSKTVIEHENVITRFVPYNEVSKYLSAADAAIIWREISVTNKVASPVKFSEYMCCGLPVITNKSIDLITNYINKNKSGVILEDIDEINEETLSNLKQLDRFIKSSEAIQVYGIETIANNYIKIYNKLIA
ncbi:MAG: glycosyltransferase [Flavobacteriaceae bacterium]|nr:glycosyltransferase [Flavobacteriaceae bacterium]